MRSFGSGTEVSVGPACLMEPQGTALSSGVEFSGPQQHPPIILKLTESQCSVSLSPHGPEQNGSHCFFQQVSQTRKMFGLRSSTSLLLCAREVKQLVDPSAFSRMNKKKGLNFKIFRKIPTAKKSMPDLWSALTQDSPWAKPQGMSDGREESKFYWSHCSSSLSDWWNMCNGWVIFFYIYNAIQICSQR